MGPREGKGPGSVEVAGRSRCTRREGQQVHVRGSVWKRGGGRKKQVCEAGKADPPEVKCPGEAQGLWGQVASAKVLALLLLGLTLMSQFPYQ